MTANDLAQLLIGLSALIAFALMRHMTAWWEGESADPETGYSHLWHAGCCILFLITYELRGNGHNDRPKP
jgi:hypothetical protein